jgi:cytosine/adenosine deaminase-related metal-dependent hydrolase
MCVHLAETQAELELLRHHQGPFVAFLKELGVWDPSGLVGSPRTVMQSCWARPRLMIHANYLAPSARIPRNTSIVYCPRTHAAFDHPTHPFRAFLERNIRVVLGTDSLASNPDLDVLAEARFLYQRYPDLSAEVLLRMATLSGAEALGWQAETGSLTPGKSADLVVLPLPNEDRDDPYHLILANPSTVEGVLCRGKWIYASAGFRPGLPLE